MAGARAMWPSNTCECMESCRLMLLCMHARVAGVCGEPGNVRVCRLELPKTSRAHLRPDASTCA